MSLCGLFVVSLSTPIDIDVVHPLSPVIINCFPNPYHCSPLSTAFYWCRQQTCRGSDPFIHGQHWDPCHNAGESCARALHPNPCRHCTFELREYLSGLSMCHGGSLVLTLLYHDPGGRHPVGWPLCPCSRLLRFIKLLELH